ncbi:hypothetical protein LXA43DRAFT_905667, partial [Ganoderma leucocontextum]
DLGTRRGLRKAHKQFGDIKAQLDRTYESAREQESPQVMAGVVGIMAALGSDAILRVRLFEAGFLDKAVELVDYPETRHVGLRTLLHFSSYDGPAHEFIMDDITSRNGILWQCIKNHSSDPQVVELAIAIMSRATRSSLSSFPYSLLSSDISIISASRTILEALRNPANYRPSLMTHALQFLVMSSDKFADQCKQIPSLLSLLIAFLRSKDSSTRTHSMIGLLNLSQADAEADHHDVELRHLGDALRGMVPLPQMFARTPREEFLRLLDCSYTSHLYRTSIDYLKAMGQAARDRDFCALGHRLADLFQQSPSTIEGCWSQLEREAGSPPPTDSDFSLYSDVLLGCAEALRNRGSAHDRVAADIIEMKFLLMRHRLAEAIALATQVLRRESRLAYAHYIISLGTHTKHSLRAARKGLQCPDVTPFLRQHMLWRAIDLSTRQGLAMIVASRLGSNDAAGYEESEMLLLAALADTQTLIDEMPPDTPLMLTILGWSIILTLITRGNRLSETLEEIEPLLHRTVITTELMGYFGYSINKTDLYTAWNLISNTYASSFEEWGDIVGAYDEADTRIAHIEPTDLEGLSAWFKCVSYKAKLRECRWCKSTNAVLKRCKGCKRAWYCNVSCQSMHWEAHRNSCRGRHDSEERYKRR